MCLAEAFYEPHKQFMMQIIDDFTIAPNISYIPSNMFWHVLYSLRFLMVETVSEIL